MDHEPFKTERGQKASLLDTEQFPDGVTAFQEAHEAARERTDRATRAYRSRRRRVALFGVEMFGEPAWDVLLILYIDRDGRRHTVGEVTALTGAAPTTVLRWIKYLEEHDLISRHPNFRDARVVFLELTPKAIAKLDTYFS